MSFDDTRRPGGEGGDGQVVSEKTCVHCQKTKPAAGFNRHTAAKDGLQSWCRDCQKENARKIRAEREAQELAKAELSRRNRSAAQKRRYAKEKADASKALKGEKVLIVKKVLPVVHASASDPVNSPEHYKTGGIECIDAMIQVFGEDAVRTYARINAFKYQWRHRYKGKPEEDLAKAAWYTRFADGDDPRKGGGQ